MSESESDYVGRKVRMICVDPETNTWRVPGSGDAEDAGVEGEIIADLGEFVHVLLRTEYQVTVLDGEGEPVLHESGELQGQQKTVTRVLEVRAGVPKSYVDSLPSAEEPPTEPIDDNEENL